MDFLGFWKFSGKVDRKTYAIVGLVAFFLKENLDRVVAAITFTVRGTFSITGRR
jgi:hypothetical protein